MVVRWQVHAWGNRTKVTLIDNNCLAWATSSLTAQNPTKANATILSQTRKRISKENEKGAPKTRARKKAFVYIAVFFFCFFVFPILWFPKFGDFFLKLQQKVSEFTLKSENLQNFPNFFCGHSAKKFPAKGSQMCRSDFSVLFFNFVM